MTFGFDAETLSSDQLATLATRRNAAAADIVRLVDLATCGHPGGSLSTLDALMVVYGCGRLNGDKPLANDRDRVIVSHGHVSPAVYSTLAQHGFFDIQDAYDGFRKAGTVFGGHIESVVPGVEWNTGNLGQGLSAACGYAMAAKVNGASYNTFCFMGDGEQQKGQISEGRRFAAQFGLNDLIALIDVNRLQIGGKTDEIMKTDLAAMWWADGWNVIEVDGHDHNALYDALRRAVKHDTENPDRPTVLLLDTIMGKGFGPIENDHKYHGQKLPAEWVTESILGFGGEDNMEALHAHRKEHTPHYSHEIPGDRDVKVNPGEARTYDTGVVTDCRSAYGKALHDLAIVNKDDESAWPIVGLSCDLEGSVKMNAFHAETPDRFIEVGIMEHHAAVMAGTMSKERIVPFFSTFGMFAMIEAYNQQRLNDQNGANPKVVSTHCGIDVGEDGPTHQCIDYVAAMRNLFGFEVYVPADANECDRMTRTIATRYAPTAMAMGRSKMPTIGNRDGSPALTEFVPGKWQTLRDGDDAVVFAFGPMVYRAVQVSDELAEQGFGLRVVNASSLQPFDRECILKCATEVGKLLTYEDHNVHTGLGCIVTSVLGESGVAAKVKKLGVSRYGTSGPSSDLFADLGLAPSDLKAAALAL